MVDAERNCRKRNTIKRHVDTLIEEIKTELNLDIPSKAMLKECIAQLTAKEVAIKVLNSTIEKEITDALQFDDEVEKSEKYNEKIIKWRHRAEVKIQETGRDPSQMGSSNSIVKLPRIIIDKFYGDPSTWMEFWDQFSATVHGKEIENSIKFNYLKSYLGGTALNCIAGLAITDKNYEEAVKLLENRFGRKDIQIHALTSKLINLNAVSKATDLTGLRKLYDSIEIQVRSLDTLGVTSDSYGAMLCPIIINKIPEEIAFEFTRKRTDDDWEVQEILDFIRKELECRERASTLIKSRDPEQKKSFSAIKEQTESNDRTTRNWNPHGKRPMLSSSTAAFSTQVESKEEPSCIFCQEKSHKTEDCTDKKVDYKMRQEILQQKRRCFICTKGRHRASDCHFRKKCPTCGRRHIEAICRDKYPVITEKGENRNDIIASTVTIESMHQEGQVILHTIHAKAIGIESDKVVRCFFDGGSERSFICEDVSRSLKLPVLGMETLDLFLFHNKHPITVTRRRVELTLRSLETENEFKMEAIEVPRITGAKIQPPREELIAELKSRRRSLNPKFKRDADEMKPEVVLIGSDHLYEIITGRSEWLDKSSVAIESILGWSIHGRVKMIPTPRFGTTTMMIGTNKVEDELVSSHLKAFWTLDALGIIDQNEEERQMEDRISREFQSKIKFKQGRYEVELPWKVDRELLSNNFKLAEKRFLNLIRRLQRDPILGQAYEEIINDYLKNGIAEIVTESEISRSNVYYLPHHPVVKNRRITTKVRIVFDASSHEWKQSSLNDCLHVGSNFNTDLFGILIKFRIHRVAFMADIEKAYLQVGLAEQDRDCTRFLWINERLDPENDVNEMKFKVLRMTRVLFGCTSSPFLLAGTIRFHIQKYRSEYPEAVKLLEENLYVDDLIGGERNEDVAYKLSQESKLILGEAGMELKKWKSNDKGLMEKWNQEKFEGQNVKDDISRCSEWKVLGISWDHETDTLIFDVSSLLEFLKNTKDTKRFILHAASRIFDPLGFMSPFVIRVKRLFQRLWEKGVNWDEDIPNEIAKEWKDWCEEIIDLKQIKISRFYEDGIDTAISKDIQLHCFCDASEHAYGACVYVRFGSRKEDSQSVLVASKTRLAPIKKITIPRLELMAAVVGARLMRTLKPYFPTATTRYWSDSSVSLCWIKGHASQWKQFIANRVSEIQQLSEPSEWFFCAGKENPADLLTRGMSASSLAQSDKWWSGPAFLKKPTEQWNTEISRKSDFSEASQERRKICVQANCSIISPIQPLLVLENYQGLTRPIRIVAWINRFTWNVRNKTERRQGPLTNVEVQDSEEFWIKSCQSQEFIDELRSLESGQNIKQNSSIRNLSPFLDKNKLLRVGGRIQFSDLEYDQRHPYIIPNQHILAKHLIMKAHVESLHVGVSGTMVQLREKYWIIRARQAIKSVLNKCIVCKKFKAKPAVIEMAPLPKERISEAAPFEVSGVDFAGPVYLKGQEGTGKAYIALFTCSVTRAIHIELVTSLSTEIFILAFKRFISRRGLCKIIYSDNAKTFKCADKELKALWNSIDVRKLKEYFGHAGIQWKYIVERAAWWGGFWERLVRSIKTPLKKILGRALLTYEEMQTILVEVEAQINSRPLTYVAEDPNEDTPLTPAHFLIGKRITGLPTKNFKINVDSNKKELSRRLRYRENLMNRLWCRWQKEYLMELRSMHCVPKQKKPTKEIKVDDLVLIIEDKLPRQMWKMGRVIEAFKGRDGLIRSCSIKTTGDQKLRRPVQLLCLLELND